MRWVNADLAVPTDPNYVLVMFTHDIGSREYCGEWYDVARYYAGGWHGELLSLADNPIVHYWMPIPKLPENDV